MNVLVWQNSATHYIKLANLNKSISVVLLLDYDPEKASCQEESTNRVFTSMSSLFVAHLESTWHGLSVLWP